MLPRPLLHLIMIPQLLLQKKRKERKGNEEEISEKIIYIYEWFTCQETIFLLNESSFHVYAFPRHSWLLLNPQFRLFTLCQLLSNNPNWHLNFYSMKFWSLLADHRSCCSTTWNLYPGLSFNILPIGQKTFISPHTHNFKTNFIITNETRKHYFVWKPNEMKHLSLSII